VDPAFVERLYPLVLSGDVAGTQALLAGLDGPALKQAQQWFATSSRWLDDIPYEAFGTDHGTRHDRWSEARWITGLCAVRLCGPATAARRVRWGDHWSHRKDAGEEALVAALCGRDRAWAATFVEEASGARTGASASHSGEVLSRILRAVGRHHRLPCPTGPTFFEFWLAGCSEDTIEDCLANDPWMPDLLHHYLASGHCGGSRDLPRAIPALLDRGLLDRTELLRHVLALLTAPQRPASQQVLAKILAQLDPKPEEIDGGLDYLIGVMSTSAGAVGRVLLPLALPLLSTEDELGQLTAVIAARPEKDQKKRLLTALTTLADRLGTEPVLAALDVLAGDDDAAFAGQARGLTAKLAPACAPDAGVSDPEPDDAGPALGLWRLEPDRHKPLTRRISGFTFDWEVSWPDFLTASGRPKDPEQATLVNEVLTALAEGRTDHLDGIMETAHALLAGGELVLSRFTNLLPDLFLGGGMRQVWPRALAFADTCAGRFTPPPTLADLLRTLVRFAPEAPRQELPPRLLSLAARKGNTKAQVEARVLGAVLAGTTLDGFKARLAASPPVSPQRSPQGLWRDDRPAGRLPEDLRLTDPEWTTASLLRELSVDHFGYEESHFPLCFYPPTCASRGLPHAWVPELLLVSTVRTVHEGGAGSLRRDIVEIRRRHEPRPIVMAIDLWAAGRLDVATFWRIAQHSEYQPWSFSPEARECWTGDWGRVGDLEGFSKTLARVPVLRPQALERPLGLTMFLRACECLLQADSNPSVLATPTWQDGTLDLDDLLSRLHASGTSGVGPLDLMQALYRLRPVEPDRAAEVPVGRWFTDPRLTTPDGDSVLDAGLLVRQWVEAGGLPPLDSAPAGWSEWTSTARGPVPWSTCSAAPEELTSRTGPLGTGLDFLRTFPLWPDLAAPYGGSSRPEDAFPAGAHGPFGKPLLARLLGMMSDRPEPKGYSHLPTFVLMAQRRQLDPAATAEVMALPRQWRGSGYRASRDEYGALAHVFRRVFEEGGMVGAWPSALAVGVAGCASASSTGLDEFLRMLGEFAIEVPSPRASEDVLGALRHYAVEPVKDAAHEQAKLLIEVLEES
jgi:hypothetical protein